MLHQRPKPDCDYTFKMVFIGDAGVGKSKLKARLLNEWDRYEKTNICCYFATKTISIEGKVMKAQIWDTAGEERYRAVAPIYYRGSVGALLVYDITKYQTFANVEKWLEELRKYANSNIFVVLVGNKSELDSLRAVSHDEASTFAERNGLEFIETSAFENINVDIAFQKLSEGIYQNISNGVPGYENLVRVEQDIGTKSRCC